MKPAFALILATALLWAWAGAAEPPPLFEALYPDSRVERIADGFLIRTASGDTVRATATDRGFLLRDAAGALTRADRTAAGWTIRFPDGSVGGAISTSSGLMLEAPTDRRRVVGGRAISTKAADLSVVFDHYYGR